MVIESIVDSARPGLDAVSWRSHDVDCSRDRHRFVGQHYAFSIEALDLQLIRRGRPLWHLIVVTERWQETGKTNSDLRTSKWLKLLAGKGADVVDWIRQCRPPFEPPKDSGGVEHE